MLNFSRRAKEAFVLYTDDGLKVTVHINEILGGQVRIGVEAPLYVHIDREELYIRKQAEKTRA